MDPNVIFAAGRVGQSQLPEQAPAAAPDGPRLFNRIAKDAVAAPETTPGAPAFTPSECLDFILTAKTGNLAKVKEWASKGMGMDLRNVEYDQTPLGEASRKGHVEVVQFILTQDSAIHIGEADKIKALTSALMDARTDIAQLILASCPNPGIVLQKTQVALGPDSDLSGARSTLVTASAMANGVPVFTAPAGPAPAHPAPTLAARAPASKPVFTQQGIQEFHDSARNGNLPKVKEYLDRGMPVDTPFGNNSITVLNHAARKGHQSMVELLLRSGAGSTAVLKQEALISAATAGNEHIAQVLLDSAASPQHMKEQASRIARVQGQTNAVALITRLRVLQ